MLQPHERITTACLNGGFLCVEIVWSCIVFQRDPLLPTGVLIQTAGILWVLAAILLMWRHRATILQMDLHQQPTPWYFWLLGSTICGCSFLAPWLLLGLFLLIRA